MKYTCFIFILSFFLTVSGQSKKISFKTGEDYRRSSKGLNLAFLGNDKDGIVYIDGDNNKLTIGHFDTTTLKRMNEKNLELNTVSKNVKSENVVDVNGNYYWLFSSGDSPNDWLAYNRIDLAKDQLLPEAGKLIEASGIIDEKAAKGIGHIIFTDKYRVNFSPDHKRMLVNYRVPIKKKAEKDDYIRIGLYVFDENMNKLWGTESVIHYYGFPKDKTSYAVDNDGNAYLLEKIYDTEKHREADKKTGRAGYHYNIVKFTKDKPEPLRINLSSKEAFIDNLIVRVNGMNELIITGTYAQIIPDDGYEGIFLAVMDQQNRVRMNNDGCYPFPKEEMLKFESPAARKKVEKTGKLYMPYLQLRDVIAEADGSVVIALEQFHDDPVHFVMHYYDHIYAVKISTGGDLKWVRKIPKSQYGDIDYTLGYKFLKEVDGYCFFYLDNRYNLHLPADEKPKDHLHDHGGVLMATHITDNGVVTKEIIFDLKDTNIEITPQRIQAINGRQFFTSVSIAGQGTGPRLLVMTVR